MKANDTEQPEIMPWQEHVEGLIVGALRGMAEAQTSMERATGGALPSLSQIRMFEAAELLVATLLESSPVCDKPESMAAASRKVGRDVLVYMNGLRKQREEDGVATLSKIIKQAGLERRRPN
jgi:hypothetical protein